MGVPIYTSRVTLTTTTWTAITRNGNDSKKTLLRTLSGAGFWVSSNGMDSNAYPVSGELELEYNMHSDGVTELLYAKAMGSTTDDLTLCYIGTH